ncbi:bifunctional DNA-formamidopyrimidine glycosylase/DNA-(apurinic or apyrimidinic site) lyase [Rhizobium leguminosarum]|uniref:Formamidopyrimidine-DNA glycosylase n=1 Tax=Rhizobium leguminosarum TaxID=384 RepID=A0A444HHY9_RHILE|nr:MULTISPECIES: bifunctional DNA-formamidopyrimidine glycosylase/DNA-(apurinic or apyrimidinic site) lyase [Rhizobium]NKL61933.1 bifunctional DNA-formamidopyrimidine glycosylase/DNA-(apurinic or apyrimidinic site) lyase [Rhizobium leguminosarum bv. viciae]RWX21010.1 bifunctional DNA-formamidopyrimidine glycosylase/DNA-(apurinic or apyrimidinic site) lyase [Rhizobium leguminosarum]TAU55775.1 bifunctional DNA-formamidopyrimidine glycosylase/DNA-(apurinic or apyrimidinic site) lyase [Rhizobium leg
MPELPEVETVKRGLTPAMEGTRITKLELRRGDLRFPFPDAFADRVSGRTIVSLGRRAKYLLVDLDDGNTLISHLGMSGSFRIEEGRIEEGAASAAPGEFHHARSKNEKHDHVVFHLEGASGPRRVVYNDPRRFGFMDMVGRADLAAHPFFRDLGPEPTGNELGAAYLAERFRDKAQPLKSALLDQKNIAGLGNIYVCEALWRAHLSPIRAAGTLVTAGGRPKAQLDLLVASIRDVIADAIAAGGSSLRDHIQTDGSLGYFQHSFSVYDRESQACRTPGCGGTVARIVQAGRSTFYCATCQK